ncbi:MAG: hypothetical protein IJY30_05645 [Muribaculaceae bacterium]|nr:hypothetical protein [Muribaculaceae bacterium]
MKKYLSFMICITVTVALCAILTNCSAIVTNNPSPNKENQSSVTTDQQTPHGNDLESIDYSIIEQSGQHYIVFDNVSIYESGGQSELAGLEFATLKEFKNNVTQKKLSDWQMLTIATSFKKDDIGVLICDFDNLYEPTMPTECTIDGVYWEGECYSFYMSTDTEIFGFIHYYTQSQYDIIFQKDYENYFDKTTITVKDTVVTEDNKTMVTYSTSAGELMQIRYEISDKDRMVIVDETYRLDMTDNSLVASPSIPTNITLYCEYDGVCFIVDLYGFTEKPSEDWLSQFVMQKYIDK